MRDPGLHEAIDAAGGVSELARKIGISQPSVSNWNRIPAERVISVEAMTGVDRALLRPDLYRGTSRTAGDIDEIDSRARAGICAARRAARRARPTPICWRGSPACAAIATPLGLAHVALGGGRQRRPTAERSSANISISSSGSGAANCCPTRSYYLTGFLHERPLARLREDLARLGIERAEGNAEPEDHAATLCEIMAGSPAAAFRRRTAPSADCSRSTWRRGSAASSPISSAPRARDFYRRVGTLGRVFIEIETEAFALPG